MLQMLGACMLLVGIMGAGYEYVEKERKIICVIERWEHIMQMFISEITYKRQPLALACYEIGEKMGEEEGIFLKEISLQMQKRDRSVFKEIWENELVRYWKEKQIDKETKELMKEFGVLTGFEDERVQKKMIEEQKEKWKGKRLKLQKEHEERKRIILLLSSCLGILMVLILW